LRTWYGKPEGVKELKNSTGVADSLIFICDCIEGGVNSMLAREHP